MDMDMDILSAKKAKDYDRIIALSAAMSPEDCASAAAAHAIGKAYEEKQAFSQSIPWHIRSFLLDPCDERFGMAAGVCLAVGKYDELRTLCGADSVDPEGFYYRAARYELALRDGGSQETQIEALEACLEIQNQHEEGYMIRLAALYLENGREKEAQRICSRVSRRFIDTEGARYAKALRDAIKAGRGLEMIREKPWLKGNVFKHISFDMSEPPFPDIRIEASAELPAPAADKAEGAEKTGSLSRKKAPGDKISPIVEKSMDGIVGMSELKASLNEINGLIQLEKKRSGAELNISKNIRILGPDGCGKTTAAYAACRALHSMGLIADAEPLVTDYESLCSDDDNELHERIQSLFENAEDRCILVENLQEFDDGNAYGTGLKILDMLAKAYNAADGAVMMIVTGSQRETEELLRKKRRFGELFTMPPVLLGAYTVDELMRITDIIADKYGFVLTDTAKPVLCKKLENMAAQPDFSYSRDLTAIIETTIYHVAVRLNNKRRSADEAYYIITEEDIEGSADEAETVEELLAKLNAMTGLASVKKEVSSTVNQIKVRKLRAEAGLEDTDDKTLHMIFTGNAGTGKTTVARILGKIYKQLGVLSKGQLIECTRKDLISQIYGETDKWVSNKVTEAMGGILFIDEAYALCRDDSDTYGLEAVQTLMTEMENHRDSFMVILAGYEAEMEKFLDKNQGLRSRIHTTIRFEDYSEDEMLRIFKSMVCDKKRLLDVNTDDLIRSVIAARAGQKDFGNARGIRNIVDEVITRQSDRLANEDTSVLSTNDFLIIRKEDLQLIEGAGSGEKRKTARDYLDELNAMTGLASVKNEVGRIIANVKANADRRKHGIQTHGFGTLHMVFKGSAGTGKTTVARLIGNIYHELGVLSQGQLVECDRGSLVAGYVGQTAAKTKAKVMEALGGVLFIDEAYSLSQGGENDFGMEAINELVADIENYRKDLCVIIAGYPSDMERFLNTNPGLKSRFPNTIIFEDYSPDEMLSILYSMVSSEGMGFEDGMEGQLREIIEKRASAPDFGNARGIRNLTDELVSFLNRRVINSAGTDILTEEQYKAFLTTITPADAQMLMTDN